MTFTFDIKDTRKLAQILSKPINLVLILLALLSALSQKRRSRMQAHRLGISSNETETFTPSMLVSPTAGNVALGKSTSNKQDWAKLQNLARAIYWTAEQKQWWKDTEGTEDKAIKKERSELSTKANLVTKTWYKGILNAHKRANPDLYKRSASTTKDVQTKVVEGWMI